MPAHADPSAKGPLAYRRATPALQLGSYQAVEHAPDDCFAFERRLGDQRIIVALNLSGQDRRVVLPDLGAGEIVMSTALDRSGPVVLADFTLRGNEGLMIKF